MVQVPAVSIDAHKWLLLWRGLGFMGVELVVVSTGCSICLTAVVAVATGVMCVCDQGSGRAAETVWVCTAPDMYCPSLQPVTCALHAVQVALLLRHHVVCLPAFLPPCVQSITQLIW